MLDLPIPKAALADCGAILGMRGAGKSGTGRGFLEHELDAGHRCCVIDPKGDWWGIRADKQGNASRFEIPVFGGSHADVEIDDSMGKQLGAIVANSSTSSVIDLSGFSRAGMLRFMAAFAEALFMENRQPLTLLVDEADQLAPQRVPAEVARLLHFMEALIRQGRQRGILMWMLTQRPAVLNKNLLTQAATLVAMKMNGPQDRKAIREWMDSHDSEVAARVEAGLPKLKVGQAYVWCPEAEFLEQVQFPLYETYDSGRTPKHGEIVGEVELKPLDVAELSKALRGEAESDDDVQRLERAVSLLQDRLRTAHERIASLTELNRTLSNTRDAALETLTAVQDRIGLAIGSPRIHAADPEVNPHDVLMVMGQDGDIRPYHRDGVVVDRITHGRRGMRAAGRPQLIPVNTKVVNRPA